MLRGASGLHLSAMALLSRPIYSASCWLKSLARCLMRKLRKFMSRSSSDSHIVLLICMRMVILPRPLPRISSSVKHSQGPRTGLMATGSSLAVRNLKVTMPPRCCWPPALRPMASMKPSLSSFEGSLNTTASDHFLGRSSVFIWDHVILGSADACYSDVDMGIKSLVFGLGAGNCVFVQTLKMRRQRPKCLFERGSHPTPKRGCIGVSDMGIKIRICHFRGDFRHFFCPEATEVVFSNFRGDIERPLGRLGGYLCHLENSKMRPLYPLGKKNAENTPRKR